MKDYFCKDCTHNNNGWCKFLKKQGLKDIKSCEHKPNNNIDESCIVDVNTESKVEAFRHIGKREMFYNIQSQMLAIDKEEKDEDKFKILKQIMVNLEVALLGSEKIFKVNEYMDSIINQDIQESSKKISEYWKNQVGGYQGK